jgi:hypothetical protein
VVPGGDEQQRGGVRTDPVQGEQARAAGGDQGDDELVQAVGGRVRIANNSAKVYSFSRDNLSWVP